MTLTNLLTDDELLERIGGTWPKVKPHKNRVQRFPGRGRVVQPDGRAVEYHATLRVTEPATEEEPERVFLVRLTDDGGVVVG